MPKGLDNRIREYRLKVDELKVEVEAGTGPVVQCLCWMLPVRLHCLQAIRLTEVE